jgi:hypothetical protein
MIQIDVSEGWTTTLNFRKAEYTSKRGQGGHWAEISSTDEQPLEVDQLMPVG